MTRDEQIISTAKHYYPYDINCHNAFLHGVEWADEHPDNVWHDASDKPKEYPIICQDELTNVWVQYDLKDYVDGWKEFKECECITRWAYIKDILPKGGEK